MIYPVKKLILLLLTGASCLYLFTGCASDIKRCGGIMPYYTTPSSEKYTSKGNVKGISSSFLLLNLVPVTPPVDLDMAAKNAMSSCGADNLHGVTWYYQTQRWTVGTIQIVQIEGEAVVYNQE